MTARGTIAVDRPVVVGILNLTPDSFWSGGRHITVDAAVRHSEVLLEDGADVLDIGGESTRPGARIVPETEEIERVIPVIREIVRRWPGVPVSVDTVKSGVARAAFAEGAWIANDVSALRLDPHMAATIAGAGGGVILMHSRGGIEDMARYELADYGTDPVGEMVVELEAAVTVALSEGIARTAIVLDPGLGFAKRTEHSVAAITQLDRFVALRYPIQVGPSRKRFVGDLTGGAHPEDRLEGTIAACIAAYERGARLFRVHDVRAARRALDVAHAISSAGPSR
ncbi:MAG: dihydropteroate synthase [Longimicrobiales bacterium]